MKAKRKGARLNGLSLPELFAAQGVSRSAGYRLVRLALGMPIAEARVHRFAQQIAAGATFPQACQRAGVSRATGYRMLKQFRIE